jgi:hypothetical protein
MPQYFENSPTIPKANFVDSESTSFWVSSASQSGRSKRSLQISVLINDAATAIADRIPRVKGGIWYGCVLLKDDGFDFISTNFVVGGMVKIKSGYAVRPTIPLCSPKDRCCEY